MKPKLFLRAGGILIFTVILLLTGARMVGAEGNQEYREENLMYELTDDMDFRKVQILLDEMLGDNSFSVSGSLKKLMKGKDFFSKEAVQNFLQSLFFDRINRERNTFFQVLFLMLASAGLSGFTLVFDSKQTQEISFYMVYLVLFVLLFQGFQNVSETTGRNLIWIIDFMKGLAPAYFLAVSAASGAVSAAAFYQGLLFLVWLLQWMLASILLPAVNLYILLKLINHLSREDMLGKLTELFSTCIDWSLKTLPAVVMGLQIVRSMIAPILDSLKRTAIGRTAGAIPALGNAINGVTELIVTSAVMVKNCLGATVLIALIFVGAAPVIHYCVLSLAYRFLAAVAQPVSDKRLVDCLATMGEGYALLLRVWLSAEVLCMLTFVILMISFGGKV